MKKILFFILFVFVCAGCSSVPKAKYSKLIVRDINWKETATSEIEGEQMKEFIASQPMLNKLFQTEFDNYIRGRVTFESIAYGNAQADSNTLIMVPKIYTLKPGGYMPGASFTGFLLSADGKLLGTYSEERRLGTSGDKDKIKGNIEKLIKELAEDAASRLPYYY